jgi:hypothetical protein
MCEWSERKDPEEARIVLRAEERFVSKIPLALRVKS